MHFVAAHNSLLILVCPLVLVWIQVDARRADAASLPGCRKFSSFRKYFGQDRKNPREQTVGQAAGWW
jgi:hypothetical protein